MSKINPREYTSRHYDPKDLVIGPGDLGYPTLTLGDVELIPNSLILDCKSVLFKLKSLDITLDLPEEKLKATLKKAEYIIINGVKFKKEE